MAAIAQSDPYQCLSRKIGYSVGLEFVADRVNALVELYVAEREVTFASWTSLVEKFGRKKGIERAKVEFANFFGSLNLLRLIGREVHVLYGLDALSVLRRYVADDDQYRRAYLVLLAHFLIEADGDIFLNCLAGNFVPIGVKERLEEMVRFKWNRISKVVRNPGLQSKLWDIVGIKSDRGGHGGAKASKSPFAARTGPSPFEGRRDPFDASPAKSFAIEASYLDKILPTRKGWATDLNLYANGQITEEGNDLLAALAQLGLGCGERSFCFWPYERDLAPLRIRTQDLEIEPLSDWGILCTLARVLGGVQVAERDVSADEVINTLQEFHQLYKSGSKTRGSIRHQLPIYIAKPLIVGKAVARKQPIPPVMQIVDDEARSERRQVTITHIRGTEGALVFKRA